MQSRTEQYQTEQDQSALQTQSIFSSKNTQTTSTTCGSTQSNPTPVDTSPYNGKSQTNTPVPFSRFR